MIWSKVEGEWVRKEEKSCERGIMLVKRKHEEEWGKGERKREII